MRYTLEQFENDRDSLLLKRSRMTTEELDEKIDELIIRLMQDLEVGDGVTIELYTDRYACTIIKRTKFTLTIQMDIATRIDGNGMSDCQEYSYVSNPNGDIHVCRWSKVRKRFIYLGKSILIGRRAYHDFKF